MRAPPDAADSESASRWRAGKEGRRHGRSTRRERPEKKVRLLAKITPDMHGTILAGLQEGLKPLPADQALAKQALRELTAEPVSVPFLDAILKGFVHARPGRGHVDYSPSFRAVVHFGAVNMRSMLELLVEFRLTGIYRTQRAGTACRLEAGAPADHELVEALRPDEAAWCKTHDAIAAKGATACYHAIADSLPTRRLS